MKAPFLAVLALGCASAAAAQSVCDVVTARAGAWNAPLDRTITLRAGPTRLPEAIERITTAARIRISYSRDLLPASRTACVSFDRVPVGEALENVLRGTGLEVVVAGKTHVVLTTAAIPDPETLPAPIVVLDGIEVSATAAQPSTFHGVATGSVEGQQLERQGTTALAAALSVAAPAVWLRPQGSSVVSMYGSVRGVSSFQANSPKIYIDGIEAANPRLVTRFDPATVERIDFASGPQSTALFGAGALGGVAHVTTRTASALSAVSPLQVRSGFGISGSAFAAGDALEQSHAVTTTYGRTARLDASYHTSESLQRSVSVVGSARHDTDRLSFKATARVDSDRHTFVSSPLLESGRARHDVGIDQYTAGVAIGFAPASPWLHSLVVGVNGYTIEGGPTLASALTPADSALAAAGTGAYRTTLRFTTTTRRDFGPGAPAVITLAAEHSLLHQDADHAAFRTGTRGTVMPLSAVSIHELARQRSNTGGTARIDVTIRERAKLSAGVRAEHTTLENTLPVSAVLPSIGGSWMALPGNVAVTLRAAYGRGISWPQADANLHSRRYRAAAEVQSGLEAGIDLALGSVLTLRGTRFEQVARGLTLTAPDSTPLRAEGSVDNSGWEVAAAARVDALALFGSLALVDSRVRTVAGELQSDLRPGDRPLGVPARTLSIGASWTAPAWNATAALTRVSDWIEYDRLALARTDGVAGPALRDYWMAYDGVSRLRLAFERDFGGRFTLQLRGDNLLDVQTGEPDNITVVPGRSLTFALRSRF